MIKENVSTTNSSDDVFTQRRKKLAEWRAKAKAYPNDFQRDSLAADLLSQYAADDAESLAKKNKFVCIAGRIVSHRSAFLDVQDMSGKIQVYLAKDKLSADTENLDLGDIVGIKGFLFRTKTNQLSIKAQEIYLLCKSLRPLPDKFHGLSESDK